MESESCEFSICSFSRISASPSVSFVSSKILCKRVQRFDCVCSSQKLEQDEPHFHYVSYHMVFALTEKYSQITYEIVVVAYITSKLDYYCLHVVFVFSPQQYCDSIELLTEIGLLLSICW